MSTLWVVIATTAVASFAIKAAGPAVLGDRELPPSARRVVALLAPALLAALVVADVLGGDQRWELDARAAGVAAAAVALLLRAPLLVTVAVAVAVTALIRLVT